MADVIRRDKGESNQQSCEGVMNRMADLGDLTGRDHKINKMGLKLDYLQHLCVGKEVSIRHCYGEIPQTACKCMQDGE